MSNEGVSDMARGVSTDQAVDEWPGPAATQPAIQQLAGLLVRDTRYMTAGYRLLAGAVSRVRCRQWPSEPGTGYAFMPALRLGTPASRLRRYTRCVPELVSAHGQEPDGCWLSLHTTYGAAPTSDRFRLDKRYQSDIGPVDVDCYVRYLGIYRRIVESHACAMTKIVAINALGERQAFADFTARHCELRPLFPLSRFQLTLDLLPGVGDKTRKRLDASDLKSIPAVAAADQTTLAAALDNRHTDAQRIKRAAEQLAERACRPTRGERLGPPPGWVESILS